jgi:hypothetical protein
MSELVWYIFAISTWYVSGTKKAMKKEIIICQAAHKKSITFRLML